MLTASLAAAICKNLRWALLLLCQCMGAVAGDLQPVSVQLNWRHQFEFAAFYAAIEQGYYREAGLAVSLIEGGPNVGAVDEVVAGSADFGVANSSLVLERFRGKPVVALAALMQHSAIVLLARRDLGIATIQDLDGKHISCPPHTCDEIKAFLRKSGLDLSRIHFSRPTHPTALGRLVGDVAATEAYFTNENYRIRGHERELVQFTPQSAGIDLFGDVLFTTDNMLDKHPDTVRRFREARLRGLTYAMSNKKELVSLIELRYNTQSKSRENLLDEADRLHQLIRTDIVEAGYMNPHRWTHVRDVYAGLSMVPSDFDFGPFVYDGEPHATTAWVKRVFVGLSLALLLAMLASLALGRMNRKLRLEIAHRMQTEAALNRSQAAFRDLVEHANTLLSHELRTPLAVIKIHADIIEHKLNQNDQAARNLLVLRQAVLRLEELFGSKLKEMFSATSLAANRQTLNLHTVLGIFAAEFRALWPEARVTTTYVVPNGASLEVAASPEMLKTVVFNLLENAVKYAGESADIQVLVRREAEQAIVSVSNFYQGPLPQNLDTLFDKGTRVDPSGAVLGTGVGLYLVRLIAQAHGGDASATFSKTGSFSVHVSLPLVQKYDSNETSTP